MKLKLFSFLTFTLFASSCFSQETDIFKFEKLIFHSSRCNGSCPQIDFQIDSNRHLILFREYFINKSNTDTSLSGNFAGFIDSIKYHNLIQVLKSSNYEKMKFRDVLCCDGVISTIIVYRNGKRTYLRSMFPPIEAKFLIDYLKSIGVGTILPKTNQKLTIEQ